MDLLVGVAVTSVFIKQIRDQVQCDFRLSDDGCSLPSRLVPFGWLHIFRTWDWRDVRSVLLFEDPARRVSKGEDARDRAAQFLLIRLYPFWKIKIDLEAFLAEDREMFLLRLYQFSERAKMNNAFIQEAERIEQKIMYLPVPFLDAHDEDEKQEVKQIEGNTVSFTALWEFELERSLLSTSYAPLAIGNTVRGGDYVITEHLASGGQSTTYCIENAAGEKFVLKESVFPDARNKAARVKARELFGREARILAKCNHPQIARVYDYFIDNDRDYLVLQHIPGLTMGQLVRRRGKAREAEVLSWASEILDILNYLHSMEPVVIHRDLTPDNLICSEHGRIFLIDFGAANDAIGTATGTMVGKQSYISPEQFRGKAVAASDIYAFGATLHFLLTGMDPIPLSSSHPRALNPLVSRDVDQFIARCTQQNDHDRPDTSSCAQIVNRLRKGQFIQGR